MTDNSWNAGGGARDDQVEEIANDYAIKILDGAHEITIWPDGHIEGFPVGRQYADGVVEHSRPGGRLVLFNRVPKLVKAAEKVGYSLGFSEATQTSFFVENAVPDTVEVQTEE